MASGRRGRNMEGVRGNHAEWVSGDGTRWQGVPDEKGRS